jgi:hypothetical protein
MVARGLSLVVSVALVSASGAQQPDVRFRVDAIAALQIDAIDYRLRYTDILARPSVFAITAGLDNGLRIQVAQRIDRVKGSSAGDRIDSAYVEDPSIWRVGKQALPLGFGWVLNETVPAVLVQSDLLLPGIPLAALVCDGGSGYPRGAVVRIGGPSLNFSAAVGRHFATAGTSLGVLRGESLEAGKGRGFDQVYAVEGRRTLFGARFALLGAVLVGGPEGVDSLRLIDLGVTFGRPRTSELQLGLTLTSISPEWAARAILSFRLDDRTWFEPGYVLRQGETGVVQLAARIRL